MERCLPTNHEKIFVIRKTLILTGWRQDRELTVKQKQDAAGIKRKKETLLSTNLWPTETGMMGES
jgi:hypothetical protein